MEQEGEDQRHRKELKALEGERRAAIKKLKATLGKKAKDAVAACEADFDAQVVALKVQHAQELASLLQLGGSSGADECPALPPSSDDPQTSLSSTTEPTTAIVEATKPTETATSTEESRNSKKQDKARRKRQQHRAAELERQRQIEHELAHAGPLPRHVELEQLQQILALASSSQQQQQQQQQQRYEIVEIPADGHCLYRAVAAQLNHINTDNDNKNPYDYQSVRALCADRLQQHPDEYAPFAELHQHDDDDNHNNATLLFTEYCKRVRSGSDWGGHLELRALATALQRPIHIYSVAANGRVVVEPEHHSDGVLLLQQQPIRLSYHVHYYALGEHYNQVVVVDETAADAGGNAE